MCRWFRSRGKTWPTILAGSGSSLRWTDRLLASGLRNGSTGNRRSPAFSPISTSHTTSRAVWRQWLDHYRKGELLSSLDVTNMRDRHEEDRVHPLAPRAVFAASGLKPHSGA